MSDLTPQPSSSTSAGPSTFFTSRTEVSEKKHRVLKRYLDAWLAVLSQNRWRTRGRYVASNPQYSRIVYVDGFAGPGVYDNGDDGSPALVYKLALTHNKLGNTGPEICLIFVEKKQDHCKKLLANLNSIRGQNTRAVNGGKVSFMVINGEFAKAMECIISPKFVYPTATFEQVFQVSELASLQPSKVPFIGPHTPLMAFADPFCFHGENMPMKLMRAIMNISSKSEILVNLMTGPICKNWGRRKEEPTINLLVGDDANDSEWKGSVLEGKDGKEKLKKFLKFYSDSLENGLNQKIYTCLFEMRGEDDKLMYNLYYASPHSTGFQKMKNAMGKESIDRNLFRFSVFDVKHENFEVKEVSIEGLVEMIVGEFRGKGNISGAEITEFIERDPHLTQRYRIPLKKALARYRVSPRRVKKFDEIVFNIN